MLEKNDFLIFGFPYFSVPGADFRGPGPGKSSLPCDSLHFGCGELDFGDCYLIFGPMFGDIVFFRGGV